MFELTRPSGQHNCLRNIECFEKKEQKYLLFHCYFILLFQKVKGLDAFFFFFRINVLVNVLNVKTNNYCDFLKSTSHNKYVSCCPSHVTLDFTAITCMFSENIDLIEDKNLNRHYTDADNVSMFPKP